MTEDRPVRTRFAPSPTGFMHIGGMRTALFACLLADNAKKSGRGGQFVLRIDDTDKSRNVGQALGPILEAFGWLGLKWDEGPAYEVHTPDGLVEWGGGAHGPYFQSQRGDLYRDAIDSLLASGAAYHDFDPPERTAADREAAEKEKRPFVSPRRSLELSAEERQAKADAGEPHVVRLLVSRDQSVTIEDAVRGEVTWSCAEMPDPVLARGDGSPLYNLASVVDDAAMEITHIVRAEEHLSNVPVQALLFDALNQPRPVFAHIPFVTAPGSNKKLSKREKDLKAYKENPQFRTLFQIADRVLPKIDLELDGTMNPVMVAFYREVGFLPAAVLNTLARLGWSYDDATEVMSLDFVGEHFSLDRVVKAPAGLDCDKMLSFQEHWMGEVDRETKIARCEKYLARAGVTAESEFVGRLVDALGDRLKLFSDILGYDEFFVSDDALTYDEKAFKKRITKPEAAAGLLREYAADVAAVEPWNAAALESHLNAFCEAREIGLGQIIHAVRVATTGKPAGPGMFDALALLGRDSVLARIDRALGRVETS